MEQLPLKLEPVNAYSLTYFVGHSGVSDAVALLQQSLQDVLLDPSVFRMLYIYGDKGTGKTHLIQGFIEQGRSLGLPDSKLNYFVLPSANESSATELVSSFVAAYEKCKTEGGLFLVESRGLPTYGAALDPHLRSRLRSGVTVRLCYPREEELRPLLRALSEKKNLNLSDYSINYLLRWLPLDPLSFESILDAINELSLSQSRRAGPQLIRELLRDRVN